MGWLVGDHIYQHRINTIDVLHINNMYVIRFKLLKNIATLVSYIVIYILGLVNITIHNIHHKL